MNSSIEDAIAVIGSAIGVTLSMTEISAAVDLASRILSIVISAITLVYLVISKVKAAKADDGEIDAEEAEDIAKTIVDGLNDVQDELDSQDTDKEDDK